jgi:hypothetical protein
MTNSTGLVLTTSTDVKHIVQNARVAEDTSLDQPAQAFQTILKSQIAARR